MNTFKQIDVKILVKHEITIEPPTDHWNEANAEERLEYVLERLKEHDIDVDKDMLHIQIREQGQKCFNTINKITG